MSVGTVAVTSGASLISAVIGAASAYLSVGRTIRANRETQTTARSLDSARECLKSLVKVRSTLGHWRQTRDPAFAGALTGQSVDFSVAVALYAGSILDARLRTEIRFLAESLAAYETAVSEHLAMANQVERGLSDLVDLEFDRLLSYLSEVPLADVVIPTDVAQLELWRRN